MRLQVDYQKLQESGIRLLVVFGSRAEGKETSQSDLDLGASFGPRPRVDLLETIQVVSRAIGGVETRLDVVELDRADPLLLFEVASRGWPLFEREPGVFEEFRISAIKRYYDTAWFRRVERNALRDRYG